MFVGVITLPYSDRVTGHSTFNVGLLKPFRTSQVSGLISFLNSPCPPPLGSCVSIDKTYKGLSAFIRVQWPRWGEYGEVKFVWVQADTCHPPHTINAFAGLFFPQDMVHCALASPYVTFDSSLVLACV